MAETARTPPLPGRVVSLVDFYRRRSLRGCRRAPIPKSSPSSQIVNCLAPNVGVIQNYEYGENEQLFSCRRGAPAIGFASE
jgi:hypothetical protein